MAPTEEQVREWKGHCWRRDEVLNIIRTSKESVRFKVKDNEFIIHKELLCHFSRYYRAALKGSFAEADRGLLPAEIGGETAMVFVEWLYDGKFNDDKYDLSPTLLCDIYIFADYIECIALRRAVLDSCLHLAKESRGLFGLAEINKAYDSLPSSSPLCSFMVSEYVDLNTPTIEETMKDAPKEFLLSVLVGIQERLRTERKGKIDTFRLRYRIRKLHEHSSEDERLATCPAYQEHDTSLNWCLFDD